LRSAPFAFSALASRCSIAAFGWPRLSAELPPSLDEIRYYLNEIRYYNGGCFHLRGSPRGSNRRERVLTLDRTLTQAQLEAADELIDVVEARLKQEWGQ
jgi:hypothetical protein